MVQRVVFVLLLIETCLGWIPSTTQTTFNYLRLKHAQTVRTTTRTTSAGQCVIAMAGLMDSLSRFLKRRQGDFIKLEDSDREFGPGPLLVLYKIPNGIDTEEVQDIIEDGAPWAASRSCRVYRIRQDSDPILELSVEKALDQIMMKDSVTTSQKTPPLAVTTKIPVLFFSGFRNDEMLLVYNLLGEEIYQETGGFASPACAKAVPKAMEKPLRQVFDEISGDHKDAMQLEE